MPTETSLSPIPTLGIGSTLTGTDGMTLLYIPAGEFAMGSENGGDNEKPVHTVNLDAFWIDKTEVTNEKYALCVNAGECDPPKNSDRFTNSGYAKHPVIFISWEDASDYCSWANRKLPTEAEWERAARGPDGNTYPWRNSPPASDLLNYNGEIGETTEVGNYPLGIGPYGALDMAGNVWEWVADWYSDTYYASSQTLNPLGPTSGTFRIVRGGAWDLEAMYVRSSYRLRFTPNSTVNYVGFRFAMSATP